MMDSHPKLGSCMYLVEPIKVIRFWGHEVTGLIIYAKTARDRVISRTDVGLLPNLGQVCILQIQ